MTAPRPDLTMVEELRDHLERAMTTKFTPSDVQIEAMARDILRIMRELDVLNVLVHYRIGVRGQIESH